MTPKQYAVLFWSVTAFGFTSMSLMILWLIWGLYEIMPSAFQATDDLVLFFIFTSITIYTIYALLRITITSIKIYLKYAEEMQKK